MLFNVESDTGDRITGYLVPDTLSGKATIALTHEGEELLRMETWEPRPALVAAGRHESGLCGYTIDASHLPSLPQLGLLEIRDVESDVIIYRRCDASTLVHRKVFRLDTHILPLNRLDRALQGRFQFYFPSVERFGLETMHQMFLMPSSVYVSGRVLYQSIDYYIDQGYSSIAVLHDPYEELAERLLVLRLISKGGSDFLALRDKMALESAIAFAADLRIDSEKDLKRAFRSIDPEIANTLSDPLARLLTARLPDEIPNISSVGAALNVLSSFSVVGLRSRADLFTEAVADLLGLKEGELPVIDRADAVVQLGQMLKACPSVERLLEHDLVLHHYVADAFEKSLTEA